MINTQDKEAWRAISLVRFFFGKEMNEIANTH